MATLECVHPVLMCSNVSTAIRFYRRLGFDLWFIDSPDAPHYAAVRRDGVELHLQWHEAARDRTRDRPVYRFLVREVDELFVELRERGALSGQADGPWSMPGDTPWGTREFHLHDLDGNGLQFYHPNP
ncbi:MULTISPECIES: VOC family protein [Dyella]|uniref:Glyoxalase/bleomycin resistance/extradiol dioxygenase family protein n=2 Tax=Dyella TaxID=231454 RepID=A0A4R0YJN0_9GAMM|nr:MULTISPECIES: VOC family protein [Dyella]TBR36081.1 glyoxalase/bleomycin resistance/extradiol dioxygenase family protein [Dyella terrae]TCI06130.1 glyoxalase/bleomycin resistance/extradiol dioxygenase family protein [Dyella soli]